MGRSLSDSDAGAGLALGWPEIGIVIPMLVPLGTEMMELCLLKRRLETLGWTVLPAETRTWHKAQGARPAPSLMPHALLSGVHHAWPCLAVPC